MVKLSASRIYVVNEEENQQNGQATFVDRVRVFLGKYCCQCCVSLPTVALVIFAFLIILLVLSIIPLAYFLVTTAPTRTDPNNTGGPMREFEVIRRINSPWPVDPNNSLVEKMTAALTARLVPPNITSCTGYGFSCTSNPSITIGKNQRCDGRSDCPDDSDEMDCESCQTSFSCPLKSGTSQLRCLRADALCDGHPQCADEADELLYCHRSQCKSHEFKCGDRCIPNEFRCDGEEHCPSGEDEHDCTACKGGSRFCKATQKCIPVWEVCNGVPDCSDRSDELDCDCIECSDGQNALCTAGSTSMCIQKKDVCDGIAQCPGEVDEMQCAGSCQDVADIVLHHSELQCDDGKHYAFKYACSGLYPQCDQACTSCNTELAFRCADNSTCVHRAKICDGFPDCADASDEHNCTNWKEDCNAESRRCDGFKDCRDDGRDEIDCKVCKPPSIYCKAENKCIPSHQRCDGIVNCQDGSDEAQCSCNECSMHPFAMYSCEQGERCFRTDDVCMPQTRCPDPTRRDRMFCATRHHSYF